MRLSAALKQFAILTAAMMLDACAQPLPERTPAVPPTLASSATPTLTPTPTPTATPTAQPIGVADTLRTSLLATPVAQRGAPCGVVDILDFPVGPPDGAGYAARWSFGRYSDRYNGIHAGEDWVYNSGDSLGKPVYSIGHGMVTYAQPLGWGIDRGVVIVRHVFPDGSRVLSFYGHLDPPSVVLKPGDCVKRGDRVGTIGKPRGRPHLHFEIREHLPGAPGPGYWPVDPTLAGWFIPSDTISDYRIKISPGVEWMRPFTTTGSIGVGLLSDGTLAAVDDTQLVGIDPGDGSLRWSQPVSPTLRGALVDATGTQLYLSMYTGSVQAFGDRGARLWQIDFGPLSRPVLMPMPGGGVVVHVDQQLIGVSSRGERLWQIDRVAPPFDWALDGDRLIFTTDATYPVVHALDRSGDLRWAARFGGRPVVAGGQAFVYNPSGVYRLDLSTWSDYRVLPLDPTALELGHVIALGDGGLLVAHRSRTDQRLIALNADGTLRWDKSIAALGRSLPRLLSAGDEVYAMTIDGDLVSIDPANGDARVIFDSGRSKRIAGEASLFATAEGQLLFDFRGGAIVALEPHRVISTTIGGR